jgi:hypothetical protein
MLPNPEYLDPQGGGEARRASTAEFLLRCLLGAREEAGRPSNEGGFDEDVNVYLVGLLGAFLSTAYHESIRRYLYPSDLDLARDVERRGDDRFRYRAYRTNADHLLLGIGLFHHVEGASRPNQPLLHREPEDFIGRGETYYYLASSSLRRLRRRSTATEVAMSKLGSRFAHYVEILRRVRLSYFHLTARLSEGELFHLLQQGDETGRPKGSEQAESLYDGFLDAFSDWKRAATAAHLKALRAACERLRAVDPSFAFEMPDSSEIED